MNSTTTKTTNLLDHNNGLSSIAVIPHGSSSSPAPETEKHRHGSHLISRSLYSPKTSSFGNLSSVYSPRSGRFFNGRFEEPHFLDACFLCKKPLGSNRDIFMYRGNIPFCSEECRAEQIEFDESKEKKWRLSASVKAMRKKKKESNSSPNYPFHSGAVAAA